MMAPGTQVVVRDDWPEARGPCHIRTPHYLRGRPGHVVRHLGNFPNPEDLAFARPAECRALYHIAFRAKDIWPDATTPDATTPDATTPDATTDEIVAELFEHWLAAPLHDQGT